MRQGRGKKARREKGNLGRTGVGVDLNAPTDTTQEGKIEIEICG